MEWRIERPWIKPMADEPKIFDLDHALEIFDGNRKIMRTITTKFIDDLPRDLDALRAAADQRDAPRIKHLAHRMAGAAGMVGALRFMALAREIETTARDGHTDHAPDQARRLHDQFELFRQTIAGETLKPKT